MTRIKKNKTYLDPFKYSHLLEHFICDDRKLRLMTNDDSCIIMEPGFQRAILINQSAFPKIKLK